MTGDPCVGPAILDVDFYRNNSGGKVSHLEGRLRMRFHFGNSLGLFDGLFRGLTPGRTAGGTC